MDKLRMESPDMVQGNVEKIAALFPNCVTEGPDGHGGLKKAVDFDKLRQMLSGDVLEGDEAYEFTWVGKKAAMVEANKPTRQTLRPCPEESKNWDTTENLYIEGDNLQVLKLLQESYLGKVKMIYIDPPYNTGHDFIYNDHFEMDKAEYEQQTSMYDEDGNRNFTENTDSNPRFHSDWCSMMYSRLMLARNLLMEDGVVFISIDDNEVDNLKKICSEIFGTINFVATFPWRKRTAKSDVPFGVSQDYEWIICFAKSGNFSASAKGKERKYYETPDFPGRPWRVHDLTKQTTASERPNSYFTITDPKNGEQYPANPNRTWAITEETFKSYYAADRIVFPGDYDFLNIQKPVLRYWKDDDIAKAGENFGRVPVSTKLAEDIGMSQDGTKEITELFNGRIFSFPKPSSLIKFLASIHTKMDDIVLDFFSGSATTAHAVMQLNAEDGGHRKFIMVQLPEACDEKSEAYKAGYKTICDIGKERIRRAGVKIQQALKENGGDIRHLAKNQNPPKKAIESTDGQMQFDVPTIPPRWSKADESDDNQKMVDALDTGFRVFKLADSNMQDVYFAPDDYNQDMLSMMESNIKPDRTALDLLFGCLLEWGLPLSMPYRSETIDGCTVHTYNDGDLIACFDENIPRSVVEAIARRQPLRAVFRDSSFSTSPEKINLTEVFKLLAPDTRIKVI